MSTPAEPAEVSLPPVLDLQAAEPLRAELMALRGRPLALDASQVTRLGRRVLKGESTVFRLFRATGCVRESRNPFRARGGTFVSKTVLTIDDSRTMREMLNHALVQAGYTVLQAVDGVEGLEVLQAQGADVVITDINMPRLDGFGVIEGVRADPNHRATPILVLTTESDAAKKERARAAGATGWIVKPFNPVKLVEAVRRVAA
jgi:two-component system, chemotaxis family, chemotaxis protein CheY